MNVLKHPALLTVEVAAHECGGNGMASRNIQALGMAKPGVTGFQFAQQILYLFFELFVTATSQDLILPGFGQFFPIRPVHTGIEVLPLHKLTDAGINLLFRLRVETHWLPQRYRRPAVSDQDKSSPIIRRDLTTVFCQQINLCVAQRSGLVLAFRNVGVNPLHQSTRIDVVRTPQARDDRLSAAYKECFHLVTDAKEWSHTRWQRASCSAGISKCAAN